MDRTSLGDRMKFYEQWGASHREFSKGLPIIIRIDGKKFSSWTKGLEKPFHLDLTQTFIETSRRLMEDHFGEVVLAYGQSDEVTFVLRPTSFDSDGQFGNKRDKLISIAASAFTAYFNEERMKFESLAEKRSAIFDSRAFAVPSVIEAYNAVLWRQQDAIRNSISSTGQAHFSHSKLHGKNRIDVLAMLQEIGVSWTDFDPYLQHGWAIRRVQRALQPEEMTDIPEQFRPTEPVIRRKVEVDLAMPDLRDNPDYLISLLEG